MNPAIRLAALAALMLAAGTASADAKSHAKAAEDFLEAMGTPKTLQTHIETMVDSVSKSNPAMDKLRPVLRKFFGKYLSYESLKGDLVQAYVEAFSEEELKELTTLYQKPVMKKMADKTPELVRKASEIGMRRLNANLPEMKKMIEGAGK